MTIITGWKRFWLVFFLSEIFQLVFCAFFFLYAGFSHVNSYQWLAVELNSWNVPDHLNHWNARLKLCWITSALLTLPPLSSFFMLLRAAVNNHGRCHSANRKALIEKRLTEQALKHTHTHTQTNCFWPFIFLNFQFASIGNRFSIFVSLFCVG